MARIISLAYALTISFLLSLTIVNAANAACLLDGSTDTTTQLTNKSQLNIALTNNYDVTTCDVSGITDMSALFSSRSNFNQDISGWDVSNVTNMSHMFTYASSFNQNINSWNVGRVTNMYRMFAYATAFNQPINNWDVSSVTGDGFVFMFLGASAFNQSITSWDISGVTKLDSMFRDTTSYNTSLSGLNTATITSFKSMFQGSGYNQPIAINTSNGTNFSYMFWKAALFDQDLGGWNMSSATNISSFLKESGISMANYDALLNGWASQTGLQSGVYLTNTPAKYSASATTARSTLTSSPNSWVISDDGLYVDTDAPTLSSSIPGDNDTGVNVEANIILTFNETVNVQSGNIVIKKVADGTIVETIAVTSNQVTGSGTNTITIDPSDYFDATTSYYVTIDGNAFDDSAGNSYVGITNTTDLNFITLSNPCVLNGSQHSGPVGNHNKTKLTQAAQNDAPITGCDVSTMTNFKQLFQGITSFNQDISGWDVSNVTDFYATFERTAFNQDIGGWNVSKATTFKYMFHRSPFNHDISSWSTGNVTDMTYMFAYSPFNQPLANWDTSKVWYFQSMFFGNQAFNQDISNWNTSTATQMNDMFRNATAFNQDIGSWNTSRVMNMTRMFSGATSFNQNLGSWDVSKITYMTYFMYGTALTTANYDQILIGWSQLPSLKYGVSVSFGTTVYSAAAVTARNTIRSNASWSISDGGQAADTTAPSFTSNATVSVSENQTAAIDVDATDTATITYRLSGDDASLFSINSSTGVIAFNSPPDYENPTDADANNSYVVTVSATDEASNTSTQALTITVTDVDDVAPTLVSSTPADGATGVNRTAHIVLTFSEAVDMESGNIVIKKTADDTAVETIDVTSTQVTGSGSTSIVINPVITLDSGGSYYITIDASAFDDGASNSYAGIHTSTVLNFTAVDNTAPVITSSANISVNELQTAVVDVNATDNASITYSLNGDDASLFTINSSTGVVAFSTAPDYENPADADSNNTYLFTVTAKDTSNNITTQPVTVTVGDVDDTLPAVTTSAPSNQAIGVSQTANIVLTFSEAVVVNTGNIKINKTADNSVVESIEVASAQVTGSGTSSITVDPSITLEPNESYFVTVDAGAFNDLSGNSYGGINNTSLLSFSTADTTNPIITSNANVNVTENQTLALDVEATDNATLTYAISGIDAAAFSINSVTGVVSFAATPDYENPVDADANNIYVFTVTIKDASNNSSNQIVTVTVTDLDEIRPTLLSATPSDEAVDVGQNANIVLTFSEAVDAETGNITIRKTADNSIVEIIAVSSAKITGSGTTRINIDPSVTLDPRESFYINIDASAFDDAASNSYAGISSSTALNFITAANDSIAPKVVITAKNARGKAVSTDATDDPSLILYIALSEADAGAPHNLTATDIVVSNGTLADDFHCQNLVCTVTVTPQRVGQIIVQVPANRFQDAAGNSNLASLPFIWTYGVVPIQKVDVIKTVEIGSSKGVEFSRQSFRAVSKRFQWVKTSTNPSRRSFQGIRFNFSDPYVNELLNGSSEGFGSLRLADVAMKLRSYGSNNGDIGDVDIQADIEEEVSRLMLGEAREAFGLANLNPTAGPLIDDWSWWTEGQITIGKYFQDSTTAKQNSEGYTLTFGMDKPYMESGIIGGAISIGKSDTDIGSAGSKSETDSYSISVYNGFKLKSQLPVEFSLGVGRMNFDNIRVDGLQSLTGQRQGRSLFFSGKAYRENIVIGDITINPYGLLETSRVWMDAYSEIGGNLALDYDQQLVDQTIFSLGADINYQTYVNNGRLTPYAAVEFGADLSGSTDAIMRYVGQSSDHRLSMDKVADYHWLLRAGFDYSLTDLLTASFGMERYRAIGAGYSDSFRLKMSSAH